MSPTYSTASASPCRALWQDNLLVLEAPLFGETWRIDPRGRLHLISFRRVDGPEWISSDHPAPLGPDDAPLSAPGANGEDDGAWTATLDTKLLAPRPGLDAVLLAELRLSSTGGAWRLHRFQLHPLVAGAVHQVFGPETDAALADLAAAAATPRTGRLRVKDNGQMFATLPTIAHALIPLRTRHMLAREVQFVDQTDHHSNLVFTREFLLHPGERCLPVQGNLVCIEDPATDGEGFCWLLLAPLRHVREAWSFYFDFLLAFQAGALVATACPAGYALARVAYTGGPAGATRALHALQRAFYDAPPGQTGRLLSNTWGDRAGAAHLSEAFVLEEIEAARRLGVEVVQIDDGWQKGATVNTVAGGGVWNGFWAADPDFWTPHPGRFPRGLKPLVDAADAAGIHLGLWYAPDSTNDLGNWERDATQILQLWRTDRIAFFKLDAVKLHSRLAESRFHALCDRVLAESGGQVFFDFDATAENRPTYWGRPGSGSLFLENRFTEQAGYYPHQTLRAVWSLAHYVRPQRIRAEFLNPARNEADYGSDPLRPSAYPPEYLFAVTLPTSPLAWFEVCRVPPDIAVRWQPLMALWKKHRQSFHAGDVTPIGQPPNGFSWTGFISHTGDGGPVYALLFRELTAHDTCALSLPVQLEGAPGGEGKVLAGSGSATLTASDRLTVHIPVRQHFLLVVWQGADASAGSSP